MAIVFQTDNHSAVNIGVSRQIGKHPEMNGHVNIANAFACRNCIENVRQNKLPLLVRRRFFCYPPLYYRMHMRSVRARETYKEYYGFELL